MARASGKKTNYNFKTNEFVKIWFSKNQDSFLPMVNQVRFINFILDHPESKFHFIYKASVLSDKAKEELTSFCTKFNVEAVDFDSVSTNSEIDSALKQQVNIEIENALNSRGGNLGAASDMARLIPSVIGLGCYLDFDTKAKFTQNSYIAKTPFIADFKAESVDGGIYVKTNNQFVAVAKKDNGKIHKSAIRALEELSKSILENYNDFQKIKAKPLNEPAWNKLSKIFVEKLSYTKQNILDVEINTDVMLLKYILTQYYESEYGEAPSIYSLRHFVEDRIKNTDLIYDIKQFIKSEYVSVGFSAEQIEIDLEFYDLTTQVIYNPLVMKITGPEILRNYMMSKNQADFLLDDQFGKSFSNQYDKITIAPGKSIDRDGDVSWFKEQDPNEPFLSADRSKIFEIEELSALKKWLNQKEANNPLFGSVQEYLILGCKGIGGGSISACIESSIYQKIICDYMGLCEAFF